MDFCLNENKCSNYYLGGFQRLDKHLRHLLALAATCSFVSDSTLSQLLEDGRLSARLEERDHAADDEMQYIFNIKPEVLGLRRSSLRYLRVLAACGEHPRCPRKFVFNLENSRRARTTVVS